MEDDSNEIIRLDAENKRLRKRLSGALQHLEEAREGLANYAQENEQLRKRCRALAVLLWPGGSPREAEPGDFGLHPGAGP